MTIRALVFDFDGLILETEGPDLLAWQELFAEHGAALSLESWCRSIGTSLTFDACAHLEELLGRPVERELVRSRHRARFLELLGRERPRDGVTRWLDDAVALGLGLAVASSSSRAWVEGHLASHGLLDRFGCLRCRDDVARAKPAPDLYLAAVEALGVAPREAVAVEDSPNGVAAAKAAGLACIAVPNGVTRPLSFEKADLVLDSLAGHALPDVLAQLARMP